MKYKNITVGYFIKRPNRFIALIEINGKEETVHVKNTGRCRELLTERAKVICEISDNPNRKTKYDLIAVYKGNQLINMDSQAPNKVFLEYLTAGKFINNLTYIKPEYTFNSSRIDFYCERNDEKYLIEVKGVTLEDNGIVMFPDAPTQRGVKHIKELISATHQGYHCTAAFVIQMDNVKYFTPNYATHPEFGKCLEEAEKAGVQILCLDCAVAPDSLEIKNIVKYKL